MLMYLKPRIQGFAMTLEALARALGGRALIAIIVVGTVFGFANSDCLGEDPDPGEGEGEGEDEQEVIFEEGEVDTIDYDVADLPSRRSYMQLDERIIGLRHYGRTQCFEFDINR